MQNTETGNAAGYTTDGRKLGTAQLLVATGFSCLKRHRLTGEYYGVKKHLRKIKQVKLKTENDEPVSERRLAEKLVRAWVDGLEKEAKCGPRTMEENFAVFCRANGVPTLEELDEYEERNKGKKGADREPSIILWPATPDQRLFPWLYFFEAESGFRPWHKFLDDLGYGQRWNPRGWYRRIDEEHFRGFGGVRGYLDFIRREGHFQPTGRSG